MVCNSNMVLKKASSLTAYVVYSVSTTSEVYKVEHSCVPCESNICVFFVNEPTCTVHCLVMCHGYCNKW